MAEHTTTMANEELDRVLDAFRNPQSTWRTLGGIARESKLPAETVLNLLQAHPELFRKSSLAPGGIPLYGLRRHSALAETRQGK